MEQISVKEVLAYFENQYKQAVKKVSVEPTILSTVAFRRRVIRCHVIRQLESLKAEFYLIPEKETEHFYYPIPERYLKYLKHLLRIRSVFDLIPVKKEDTIFLPVVDKFQKGNLYIYAGTVDDLPFTSPIQVKGEYDIIEHEEAEKWFTQIRRYHRKHRIMSEMRLTPPPATTSSKPLIFSNHLYSTSNLLKRDGLPWVDVEEFWFSRDYSPYRYCLLPISQEEHTRKLEKLREENAQIRTFQEKVLSLVSKVESQNRPIYESYSYDLGNYAIYEVRPENFMEVIPHELMEKARQIALKFYYIKTTYKPTSRHLTLSTPLNIIKAAKFLNASEFYTIPLEKHRLNIIALFSEFVPQTKMRLIFGLQPVAHSSIPASPAKVIKTRKHIIVIQQE